jgi:uncharacterized membrane protein YqaE (UPF0057 family)
MLTLFLEDLAVFIVSGAFGEDVISDFQGFIVTGAC